MKLTLTLQTDIAVKIGTIEGCVLHPPTDWILDKRKVDVPADRVEEAVFVAWWLGVESGTDSTFEAIAKLEAESK